MYRVVFIYAPYPTTYYTSAEKAFNFAKQYTALSKVEKRTWLGDWKEIKPKA